MNLGHAEMVARAARSSAWFGGLAGFGATVRRSVSSPGQLLVVGTPEDEPWHFVAHLEMLARLRGTPELAPTLLRWKPPTSPTAPGVGIEELTRGGRDRTVLVLAEGTLAGGDGDDALLERLHDARHRGATVLGMSGNVSSKLVEVAHEVHAAPATGSLQVGRVPVTCDFELASHLLGVTATSAADSGWRRPWRLRRTG